MINLLHETEEILRDNGKSFGDVKWIGGADFTIPIVNYIRIADKKYDNDFGAPKVAQDLKIVGDDWWLERYEYDGSEEWVFKSLPKKPQEEKVIKKVICEEEIGWRDLKDVK